MKYLLTLFLCFFASTASASSADSGKCPWKLPFTISIHGMGNTYGYGNSRHSVAGGYVDDDTSYWIPSSTYNFSITIDTIVPAHYFVKYSLRSDSLRFSILQDTSVPNNSIYDFQSIVIAFAPEKDSIVSITFLEVDSGSGFFQGTPSSGHAFRDFKISSLLFDDSSIHSTDSSILGHDISMTDSDFNGHYYDQYNFQNLYTDFTASSVTLSGIFRPTTFSNPASIVTEAPQPNNLAIYSSNGSIACSFDVADHARDLEIFSPLGIREANFTIQAGQTESSLPHLPTGFYFVRLDGSMAKVYISD
jgi:hypothetical protein